MIWIATEDGLNRYDLRGRCSGIEWGIRYGSNIRSRNAAAGRTGNSEGAGSTDGVGD
mgnify:CR=1 FL=1